MDNTKNKGNIAELAALLFFKRKGFSVALPYGDNEPYDLVAESPTGRLYRVQVRAASWKNNSLTLGLRSCTSKGAKTLDLSRIEVFALYDDTDVYIIPVALLEGCRAAFTIRHKATKNKQTCGVHWAEDFRNNTTLMP